MEERADAYENNCIPCLETEKGGHDFLARARTASSTIYAKEQSQEFKLEDFIAKKVIGQGSFGKVYMVMNKHNNKVYAMKSIRKDVVINSE